MKTYQKMQLAGAIYESVLAVPILGGLFIISFLWFPLLVALALHIFTLVLTVQEDGRRTGPVLGIIAACVGWIPFVGWAMHGFSAIWLYFGALRKE